MGNQDQLKFKKFHSSCHTFPKWYARYGDLTVSPDSSIAISEFLLEFVDRKSLTDFIQETQHRGASPMEILTILDTLPVVAISTSYAQIEGKFLPDSRIIRIYGNSPLYLCTEPPQNIHTIVDFKPIENPLHSFTGEGVRVALIDSGIHSQHPDLSHININRINEVAEMNEEHDLNGHGTFLASLIAGSGKESSGKYRGVAPDVDLLDVKVFNREGRGTMANLLHALDALISLPTEQLPHIVVFGGLPSPVQRNNDKKDLLSKYATCLVNKGIAVIVPTGNFGPDEGYICSPGLNPDVLCVGGIDNAQNVAFFSGRSGRSEQSDWWKPDLVLPAVNVIGAKSPLGIIGKAVIKDSSYMRLSGTSVSAATAGGMLALLKQSYPDFTPHQLYQKFLSHTTSLKWNKGSGGPGIPDLVALFRADGKLLSNPLPYMTILLNGLKNALYFVVLAVLAFYFF